MDEGRKGIIHRGVGAYLRCPVSTSVHFSLRNEGSSEYIGSCEGKERLSPNFQTFMEPRNRFQGMNSASLCSLAGQYDNPIPPRFLATIDSLKIPVLSPTFQTLRTPGINFTELVDWFRKHFIFLLHSHYYICRRN